MNPDPPEFLCDCDVIDFRSPEIARVAGGLAAGDVRTTAERCFRFVRDDIKHSFDYRLNPVTCRASDVLQHGTGYCYAKSHLLCALLRANQIPAGLCYQRLTIDGNQPPYCLHCLNAVFLPNVGWYRIDARGNRDDIDAQFCPPEERLAFSTALPGEYILPEIYVAPLPAIVDCLSRHATWDEVYANLPDVPGG